MTHDDLVILAKMYADLLTERVNRIIYGIITSVKHPTQGHIEGSYPKGMFYVYNYPHIFEKYEHILKMFDTKDPGLNANLVIMCCKHFMDERSSWRLQEESKHKKGE